MRRLHSLLFCILFVGLIAKPCWSEEGKGFAVDGYKWESWNNLEKCGWVVGFCDGLYQAVSEGSFHLVVMKDGLAGVLKETESEVRERIDKRIDLFTKSLDFSEITVGQAVDGLDKFYRDYRNKTILTTEAIWIVKLEVKGASQEFINQETRILRMPNEERLVESSKLFLKNEAYKEAAEKWRAQIPFTLHW